MIPSRLSEVWPTLSRVAREEGVIHIGASDIEDAHAALFGEWIERGNHASMAYLAKNAAIRARPLERFPWAKSVVSILVPYSSERPDAAPDALSHTIARYALGDDYHDVLDAILRKLENALPGVKTWRYVDTGPLSDRSYARTGRPRLDRQERHADPRAGRLLLLHRHPPHRARERHRVRARQPTAAAPAPAASTPAPPTPSSPTAPSTPRNASATRPSNTAAPSTPTSHTTWPATPSAATSARKSAPGTAAPRKPTPPSPPATNTAPPPSPTSCDSHRRTFPRSSAKAPSNAPSSMGCRGTWKR